MPRVAGVDVVVVGAGPAGSMTALLLASAGHDVLLLERREFLGPKPCGDRISAGATAILRSLGLLPRIEMERPAHLTGWRIISPSGRELSGGFGDHDPAAPHPETALSLPRARLDRILLNTARQRGVEVQTGTTVTDLIRSRDGAVAGVRARGRGDRPMEVRARLVVGADGLRSIVARRLGLLTRPPRLRKVSLTTYLHGVHGLGSWSEMHLAADACAGLAPVHATRPGGDPPLSNLTIVVDGDRFAREIATAGTAAFFSRILRRFPLLAARLPEPLPEPASAGLLTAGPFDWKTRSTIAPGAALVGDAAGCFDPFTGQGIYQGLAAALILAEEAGAALRNGRRDPPLLRRYARRRERLLQGAKVVQRAIETVISRPTLADNAIRILRRAPRAAETITAITGDRRPARSLLNPAVAFSLLLSCAGRGTGSPSEPSRDDRLG